KTGALGEVAAVIGSAPAEQVTHGPVPQAVQLVDGTQHGQATFGIVLAAKVDGLQHPVQDLAVIDLDQVVAALDAQRLHRVGCQHADFRIGGDIVGPHR